MNKLVVNVLLFVINVLNYIVPKNKKNVIFYSFPDYSDNCRALYERLVKTGNDKKYNITWVVRDVEKYREILPNVKVVKHSSIGALVAFLRAYYIVRTHDFFGNTYAKGKQKMCIAWHGMLIKGYHYSEMGTVPKNNHDYFCVTSPLFQDIFAKALDSDKDRFNVTGYPRNDYMFEDSHALKEYLGIDSFDKVIIWMPTFRNFAFGQDGVSSDFGLPTLHEGDLEKLNDVLNKNNFVLLLKLHPWALDNLGEINYSNIRKVNVDEFPFEYSLYHLLSQTDAMISDYSSVWGDYLMLDRPICFAFDDFEEYSKQRCLPLTPLEDYMPGMKTKNVDELIEFIESLNYKDEYSAERTRIREMFILDCDGNSSERLLKAMNLI